MILAETDLGADNQLQLAKVFCATMLGEMVMKISEFNLSLN